MVSGWSISIQALYDYKIEPKGARLDFNSISIQALYDYKWMPY